MTLKTSNSGDKTFIKQLLDDGDITNLCGKVHIAFLKLILKIVLEHSY